MTSPFDKTVIDNLPPRLARPAKVRPFVVLVSAIGVAAGVAILFWFNPTRYGFYPFCAFYRSTGLLCPGCGSLRALHQLLHGHIVQAIHFNALLVLSLPLLIVLGMRECLNRWQGKRAPFTVSPTWQWFLLGVLILYGLLRNLPFAQAAWLAP